MKAVLDIVRRHKAEGRGGLYSVCTAHPEAIAAACELAASRGGLALIEATSNQVNPEGGYTGMTPAVFRERVAAIAAAAGLPAGRLLLGGDHLGPHVWRAMPAARAMARAEAMVDAYVAAGFRKIHLDCSMPCADDPPALGDERVAGRAALLCAAAERRWQAAGGEPPVYIVGTEVPPPGGARESLAHLQPTRPAAARDTLEAHRRAFAAAGLQAAWERVVGLVVQPGVEFGHAEVVAYRPEAARELSHCLDDQPHVVFEAHSTDYQRPEALAALVRDHYAILKVGPAATFALREALWSLDALASEWLGPVSAPGLRAEALAILQADPSHWRGHVDAASPTLALDLQYSLSDRIRYYWAQPGLAAAVAKLLRALEGRTPPLGLLRQFLPRVADAQPAGGGPLHPLRVLRDAVQACLLPYALACET